MASKTFFKNLKETCQKIDNDVNNIKVNMMTSCEDDKEEVASRKICEIQDKISAMKTEANDLKSMLGPKLSHTRDFIKNFKELMEEIKESISKKEEYLKQYGYTPVESIPQAPEITVENNITPNQQIREDLDTTPNLLDYGISSYALTPRLELNRKNSIESPTFPPDLESPKPIKPNGHSDSTPTLDIADMIPISKPEETPPLPEPYYTPAKETPPLPEPYYTPAKETLPIPKISVAYSSLNFPSTPKLDI